MRALVLSDIHAEEQARERATDAFEKGGFDCIFILGDITHEGPVSFAEDLLMALPKAKIFAVPGNMDTPEVAKFLEKKRVSVHASSKVYKGFKFAGFGGSNIMPFSSPLQFSEDEIRKGLAKAKINKNTILLTHAPPYVKFDEMDGEHMGSREIRKAIEKGRPLLALCGHVHEVEGIDNIKETVVVSVGAAKNLRAAVVEFEKGKVHAELINL
ncbi:MAG: metallophosphoesterase family protein [Candidatus Micrarchaeota archaeon]|nr:metallophosphoesterase family protein [Candidatus Micrarchaeota archaeon]